MTKIVWDDDGQRYYETGVKNAVLYVRDSSGAYPSGVAWNGITSITETPSGAEPNDLYADDGKYVTLTSAETFAASLEAYTYPEEFEECDGSAEITEGVTIGQQSRKSFGLGYRTTVGNDVLGEEYGYKLHLIYGAKATPSEKAYQTVNDSPDAITLSWELNTTPVHVDGYKDTSIVTISSNKSTAANLKVLEAVLFGVDSFSSTKTYAVGDFVTYSSVTGSTATLYKCSTAVTSPGEWQASSWTAVTVDSAAVTPGPRLPLPNEVKSIMTPVTAG